MAQAMKKRKKKLWLVRGHSYSLFESVEKPSKLDFTDWLKDFCIAPFERLTGISLKCGEVREVKSIKIELVEEK